MLAERYGERIRCFTPPHPLCFIVLAPELIQCNKTLRPKFKNVRYGLVFVPGKLFQPSLMFASEARAYLSEASFKHSNLHLLFYLSFPTRFDQKCVLSYRRVI